MRILVVEDDPTIASFVVKGLQDAGFAVDHAENGAEALHLASSEDYAVAVVDIMLPGMDGLAVIEEMRRRRIKTPVIILSARRTVDDRVKGLQAGGEVHPAWRADRSRRAARGRRRVARRSRHRAGHLRGRPASHLRSAVPRGPQPFRTGPGPGAEPGEGHRRSPPGPGFRAVQPGPGQHVHRPPSRLRRLNKRQMRPLRLRVGLH